MKLDKTLFAVAALLITPAFAPAAHVDLGIAVGTPPPPPPAAYVAGPVGVAPDPAMSGWTDIGTGWVDVMFGYPEPGYCRLMGIESG